MQKQRAPIASGLVASGELDRVHAWGLRWVRHHASDDADVSPGEDRYPVVVLSPGNATSVAFYTTIAEEMASRGCVVAGVDHPYHVAAVRVPDGTIAIYDPSAESAGGAVTKVEERVADLEFVMAQLASEGERLLGGRVDTNRVAWIGHSLGGLAAVELCHRSDALAACANIDGQSAGGPFGISPSGSVPDRPFLYLTKEAALHPEIAQRFAIGAHDTYRVVIPAASHDQFADRAFVPPRTQPVRTNSRPRGEGEPRFVAAFLDIHFLGAPQQVLTEVPAPTDVFVNVYPLRSNPPLPLEP